MDIFPVPLKQHQTAWVKCMNIVLIYKNDDKIMMTKIEETRLGVSADFEPRSKGTYQIINSELSKMNSHGMYECLKSTVFF